MAKRKVSGTKAAGKRELRPAGNGKNYNEADDVRRRDIRRQMDHSASAGMLKIVRSFLPSLWAIVEKNICTSRRKESCEYDDVSIVLTVVLVFMLGLKPVSGIKSQFISSEAVQMLEQFIGQEISEAPDYQTLSNALSSIIDLEGFNRIYIDILLELISSRNFEKHWPEGCFETMNSEGKYELMADRILPVILDATELYRSQKCWDESLLMASWTDEEGNQSKPDEYFSRVLVAKAVLAPELLVTIGMIFIENEKSINGQTEDHRDFKQSCETECGKAMIDRLAALLPKRKLLIQGDALYLTEPMVKRIMSQGWGYLITFKEGSQPSMADEYKRQVQRAHRKMEETGEADGAVIQKIRINGKECVVEMCADAARKVGKDFPMSIYGTVIRETLKGEGLTEEKARKAFAEMHPDVDFRNIECVEAKGTAGEVVVTFRGMWATNLVLQPKYNPTAKRMILKELGRKTKKGIIKPEEVGRLNALMTNYLKHLIRWGRQRWLIENQGFNAQKNSVLQIKHRKSRDYRTFKAYVLCAQIADTLFQLWRLYDKVARLGCRTAMESAQRLRQSIVHFDLEAETAYMERRTAFHMQRE